MTWRTEHPRATLADIEAAVQDALSRLQARYLADLVHTSAAADLRHGDAAARPVCPNCSGALRRSGGAKTRSVLTPGQTEPVQLHRDYAVCSTCGVGLFPPG
jgi:predicted RNA-binding Zn-ribbon protein involved in translation (DUF1610 family)